MYTKKWVEYPFPHLIIDNFLPEEIFLELKKELNQNLNIIQRKFESPLESKTIYKNSKMKNSSKNLVSLMASREIKKVIKEKTGEMEILSMGETKDYSGYSPYHITNNNGFLGSHIDHSNIQSGKFRHIANTIFFASNSWEEKWGGQTIFFSNNGLNQEILVEPIPNRLLVFIHTANSFHGVKNYFSDKNIERRTFYHDYYINSIDLPVAMHNINKQRKKKLKHSFHTTTFIPFFPFGVRNNNFKNFFDIKNLFYLNAYLIYLYNYAFNKKVLSFKNLFLKKFQKLNILK